LYPGCLSRRADGQAQGVVLQTRGFRRERPVAGDHRQYQISHRSAARSQLPHDARHEPGLGGSCEEPGRSHALAARNVSQSWHLRLQQDGARQHGRAERYAALERPGVGLDREGRLGGSHRLPQDLRRRDERQGRRRVLHERFSRVQDVAVRVLGIPYGGYFHRHVPAADETLTRVGPGTPAGELLRRYWQPVAYSHEVADLPIRLKILHEDLVLFRDRSGRVGVLELHCAHRGSSLEFGLIAERGIRCCYHGWLYDVDGTILET